MIEGRMREVRRAPLVVADQRVAASILFINYAIRVREKNRLLRRTCG